jgi:hypothetical protein
MAFLKRSLYFSEPQQLMVSLLKCLTPCDQLLDRVGIIARTEAAQLQIGMEDTHAAYRAIQPQFDFRGYRFDVPMRFNRHRMGKIGIRSYRLSKHEDTSADAQHPIVKLVG